MFLYWFTHSMYHPDESRIDHFRSFSFRDNTDCALYKLDNSPYKGILQLFNTLDATR